MLFWGAPLASETWELGESCLDPGVGPRWVARLHPSQSLSQPKCSDSQQLAVLLAGWTPRWT